MQAWFGTISTSNRDHSRTQVNQPAHARWWRLIQNSAASGSTVTRLDPSVQRCSAHPKRRTVQRNKDTDNFLPAGSITG
jgi:hypothetical protein